MSGRRKFSTTIADGQTKSSKIELGDWLACSVEFDSGLEGTSLTFEGSNDDSTYQQILGQSGSAITYTVAASKSVSLDPTHLAGFRYIKLVMGTSQTGSTTIVVGAYA